MKIRLSKKYIDFIQGKTIVSISDEETDEETTLVLKLNDGSILRIGDDYDMGADGGLYFVATCHLNDEKIWSN